MKDYNFGLSYYSGKGNVVADALSKKYLHVKMLMVWASELNEQFRSMSLLCEETPISVKLGMMKFTSGILHETREGQMIDLRLIHRLVLINWGENGDFMIHDNGVMRFRGRVCVLDVSEFNKIFLEKGHRGKFSIHPGARKMYHDMKKIFGGQEWRKRLLSLPLSSEIKVPNKINK